MSTSTLKVCVLASGSKANSVFLRCGETRILVDMGLGIRNFAAAMQAIQEPLHLLDAIFITHEHTDHVRGLARYLSKFKVPVYAGAGTLHAVDHMLPAKVKATAMASGCEEEVGLFGVQAMRIPHDAADPRAYTLVAGTRRVTIATDLGEVPKQLATALEHSTVAIFESNHDVDMLLSGPYPPDLQDRILSRTGHLSNHQTAQALKACRGNGLQHVVLAHISVENNHPGLALKSAMDALKGSNARVHLTKQVTVGPMIEV